MFVDKLTEKETKEIFELLCDDKYEVENVSAPIKVKFWTTRKATLKDISNNEYVTAIMSDYCCYIKNIAYVNDYCNYMLRRFGSPYLKRADEKGVDSKNLFQNYIIEKIKEGKQTTFEDGLNPFKKKSKDKENSQQKAVPYAKISSKMKDEKQQTIIEHTNRSPSKQQPEAFGA